MSKASNAAAAAPLAQMLAVAGPTSVSAPKPGVAEARESVTTGMRLFTSAMVTPGNCAAERAPAGSAAYRAPASGSRTNAITKSSNELAMPQG